MNALRLLVSCAHILCTAALAVPFTPPNAESVTDPDARWAIGRMQRAAVAVPGIGSVDTSFYRAGTGPTTPESGPSAS